MRRGEESRMERGGSKISETGEEMRLRREERKGGGVGETEERVERRIKK